MVVDLPQELREKLKTLLTFDEIPTPAQLQSRAKESVDLLEGLDQMPTRTLIDGAPFFIDHLEEELRNASVIPTYAFSKQGTTNRGSCKTISAFFMTCDSHKVQLRVQLKPTSKLDASHST